MAKNPIARRKATKLEKRATSANRRAAKWKEEAQGTLPALWRGFTFLTGAAAAGALRGKMPEGVMGIPIEVFGGLLAGGAGLATRSPMTINFATGFLAPYVADMAQEAVTDSNVLPFAQSAVAP